MATKFWAKTGTGQMRDDGSPIYHPVICHLADTAAVNGNFEDSLKRDRA